MWFLGCPDMQGNMLIQMVAANAPSQEPPATGVASNTAQHPTAATSAAMRRRARSKAAGRGNQAPPRTGRDRTRQERYTEVEAYWRSLRPEQRQELLRVPLAALLQGVWVRGAAGREGRGGSLPG
jgi:hypothetical protein